MIAVRRLAVRPVAQRRRPARRRSRLGDDRVRDSRWHLAIRVARCRRRAGPGAGAAHLENPGCAGAVVLAVLAGLAAVVAISPQRAADRRPRPMGRTEPEPSRTAVSPAAGPARSATREVRHHRHVLVLEVVAVEDVPPGVAVEPGDDLRGLRRGSDRWCPSSRGRPRPGLPPPRRSTWNGARCRCTG